MSCGRPHRPRMPPSMAEPNGARCDAKLVRSQPLFLTYSWAPPRTAPGGSQGLSAHLWLLLCPRCASPQPLPHPGHARRTLGGSCRPPVASVPGEMDLDRPSRPTSPTSCSSSSARPLDGAPPPCPPRHRAASRTRLMPRLLRRRCLGRGASWRHERIGEWRTAAPGERARRGASL